MREPGARQGGRGQPTSRTPPVTRPVSSSSKRPNAILQPPPRQQSSSPVPRHHTASPNEPSQQSSHVTSAQQQPGSVNFQPTGAPVNGTPNGGAQLRTAQNGVVSQGRRQRQQRASPSPGQDLHRQAVHARAQQAKQQSGPADKLQSGKQTIDASVLRAQPSNVMPSPAGVALSATANGVSPVAQKASTESPDLQRTSSGKLRATAAPFVPRSSSGSPLSTSSM